MNIDRSRFWVLAAGAIAAGACGNRLDNNVENGKGAVRLASSMPSLHDVVAVHYRIFPIGSNCSGTPLAETTVALEDQFYPNSIGLAHRFADALFTVAPGSYDICSTPLRESGDASTECSATSSSTNVVVGTTSEVVMLSECAGLDRGAIDAVTVFDDPPNILGFEVDPSKFLLPCEQASLRVTGGGASPDGDPVLYGWSLVSGSGRAYVITQRGGEGLFTSPDSGNYQIRLTARDVVNGRTTTLDFPIHVGGPECTDQPTCSQIGVCAYAQRIAGCSDRGREGFTDTTTYRNIAGCSGAWTVPGIHNENPGTAPACGIATYDTVTPACYRNSGDDSDNANGTGCNVQDLCADGWHVCTSAADVASHSNTGCDGAVTPEAPPLFFATRQSSNGCGVCATGTRTDPDCDSASCTRGCAQTAKISNDIFGCGNFGSTALTDCGPLQRSLSAPCSELAGSSWSCDSPGGVCEAYTVTKAAPAFGGVLCCRD